MSAARVAVRYARAFIEALREKDALADAQSFLSFCELVEKNAELSGLFGNVTVNSSQKSAVAKALAEKLGLSTLVTNFLLVLADAGRLAILKDVGQAVADKLDELNNVQTVSLTTSVALGEEELSPFRESMKQKLGSDIRVTTMVDPSIIGGALARVGSVVYDGSVRAQLNRLRAELVKEN